jgi:hypothetical protein
MYENSDSLFEYRNSYQDSYRLLDAITGLDRITSNPKFILHISKLLNLVLPCKWGGIRILECYTHATPVIVYISQGAQSSGMCKTASALCTGRSWLANGLRSSSNCFIEGISLTDHQKSFKNVSRILLKNLRSEAAKSTGIVVTFVESFCDNFG